MIHPSVIPPSKKAQKKKKRMTQGLDSNPKKDATDEQLTYAQRYSSVEEEAMACPCCRVCMMEVFQCQRGHVICKACYQTWNRTICSTCKVDMPMLIPNRFAETLVKELIIKCPHCTTVYLPHALMRTHEQECKLPLLHCWHCSEFTTKYHAELLEHWRQASDITVVGDAANLFHFDLPPRRDAFWLIHSKRDKPHLIAIRRSSDQLTARCYVTALPTVPSPGDVR